MELSGKKVLVMGAAKSGVASAQFLKAHGATVALYDKKPLEEWTDEARSLKEEGIGLVNGEVPVWLLDQVQLVLMSPGVPTNIIPARYAERAGAEVIGEVELAFRFMRGRIVGITGSNGKTTTTTLIGEILKDAGLPTQVGGNIGTPLISMVESSRDDGWTVAELSSFQLETIADFRPNIAVVLNVTPNHMDRYDSFLDYAGAKHRIFRNQTSEDVAILNADDQTTSSWTSGLKAYVVMFSTKRELEEGLFLREGRELVCRNADKEKVLTTRDEMNLRGRHNIENVLAALATGLACGVSPDSMRDTIGRFKPVEHRLELSAEIEGVKFYNDSKATSVDATLKALEALSEEEGKIILILGGRGKKAPYAPLVPLIKSNVHKLVLIGEDADTIESELKGVAEIERANDMKDAVRISFESAINGDMVLLSPACASFDMFKSFEHRGDVFKSEVQSLKSKIQSQ